MENRIKFDRQQWIHQRTRCGLSTFNPRSTLIGGNPELLGSTSRFLSETMTFRNSQRFRFSKIVEVSPYIVFFLILRISSSELLNYTNGSCVSELLNYIASCTVCLQFAIQISFRAKLHALPRVETEKRA